MHFVIFHPYDTPTIKTKVLRLVSNEGRVKRLLQPYKWLIQPYLIFFGCNWRRISLLGPHLMMTSTERAIKRKWKAAASIQPIIESLNHATVIYGLGGVHTCIHTYTRASKVISRNQVRAGHNFGELVPKIGENISRLDIDTKGDQKSWQIKCNGLIIGC